MHRCEECGATYNDFDASKLYTPDGYNKATTKQAIIRVILILLGIALFVALGITVGH